MMWLAEICNNADKIKKIRFKNVLIIQNTIDKHKTGC